MPLAIESAHWPCSLADARTCTCPPQRVWKNHNQVQLRRRRRRRHHLDSHHQKSTILAGPLGGRWLLAIGLLTLITFLTLCHAAPPLEAKAGASNKRADRLKRAATARLDRLWDDAVIPYEIDQIFSDERASLFRSAMRHWENYTCIKFVERIPEEHKNYIVFTERSCGCCSFVGKRGNGPQAISIGKHCDKFGIVVHELGHVVGFWHEHTRPDRDQHVQIIGKNIMAGQEYNFNKLTKDEVNSLGLAYDYDSILHYATNTFAKDVYLDTILPLHGLLNTEEVAISQTASGPTATTTAGAPVAVPVARNDSSTMTPASGQTNYSKLAQPNRLAAQNSSQLAPHMINDQAIRNVTQIRQQIELDFQSMLAYGHTTTKANNERLKRSSHSVSIQAENRIMIIDGGGLLISLAHNHRQHEPKSSGHKRRLARSSMPVDFDDKQSMLATDNLLAKTRPEIGQRVRLSVGDIAQTNLLYKCPKCGRTIHQLSGIFHSPDYYRSRGSHNDQIDHHQNQLEACEWRLTVGLGERIVIEIMDLDIARSVDQLSAKASPATGNSRLGMPKSRLNERELHDVLAKSATSDDASDPMIMNDCTTDYLEIRDGYTYRAPIIAKLCGQFVSLKDVLRPIVSTSNRLLVSYRTNSQPASKRGFLAQHETVCGGTIMLGGVIYDPLTNLQNAQSSSQARSQINAPNASNQEASGPASAPTSSTQKSPVTGAPISSENEVLLSSQNNVRYNSNQQQQQQQQQQQNSDSSPTAPNSDAIAAPENSRRGENLDSGQLVNNQSAPNGTLNLSLQTPRLESKYFSWHSWPLLNSTIIQSPNWPEHYRASRECFWRVKAEENHQILLRFEAFDLESHDSCAYDYVEIRDGDSLNSNIIGRYCSNRVPEQVISSGANLLVKFVSDSDVNKAGFIASLQLEVDECKLGTHGCSYKCSNAAVPYKCECPNGLELAPDGRNCIPTCGGLRNESSGQITSPSFPDLYPISTRCVWDIHAPAHHKITLNFTHFDLEGIKSQECDYDFVEIWSRVQDSKYIRNGIFCGTHQAFSITSVANFMRIEFNSDNSIQKSGFEADFFIDRDECGTNNGGCQQICINNIGSYQCSCNNGFVLHENKHDCIGSHCLHHITSPEGTFHSPDFPSLYQPNKECGWIFSTAPGHRIKLIFDQFDLESHQECTYDHVAVFDGQTMDDHLLGRFCGSRKPLTLVSSYNLLYLVFRSDATNERRGFNATHSTVCGGRLQASLHQNGLIFSHPSFDGTTTHYNRNEDCDWIIEASENQRIRAEFTFFSLEADANCNYDQTLVYDGADDSATQMARLCGTDLPKEQLKFTSTAESMLIIFKSDDSINSKGFTLTYTAFEIVEDDAQAMTYSQQQQQQQQQQPRASHQ